MAVAADGLVPLDDRASADTVMAKLSLNCPQEGLAGDVSMTCVITVL